MPLHAYLKVNANVFIGACSQVNMQRFPPFSHMWSSNVLDFSTLWKAVNGAYLFLPQRSCWDTSVKGLINKKRKRKETIREEREIERSQLVGRESCIFACCLCLIDQLKMYMH